MPGRVSQLSLPPMPEQSGGRGLFLSAKTPGMRAFEISGSRNKIAGEATVARALENSPIGLQRFYVGDDVFDLSFIQDIFEWRHQRVAVFDPGFQRLFGELVVVHGKCAALGDSF